MSPVPEYTGPSPGSFNERLGIISEFRRGRRALTDRLDDARSNHVPEKVLEAHATYAGIIEGLYGTDDSKGAGLLFHGTGAVQYSGHKYIPRNTAHTSTDFRHPLERVLKDGLIPHFDPWIVRGFPVESVSLTRARMYAKWFADKHQPKDKPLEWEFGSTDDWFSFYMGDTMAQTAQLRNIPELLNFARYWMRHRSMRIQRPKGNLSPLQSWGSHVNSDINSAWRIQDVLSVRTDIPENYGAIIGVAADEVDLFDMGIGRDYEQRTYKPILPDSFRVLEVPMAEIERAVDVVQRAGLNFPVVPMEVVDYHLSQFPLDRLTVDTRST